MAQNFDEQVAAIRHRRLEEASPFTFVTADALTIKDQENYQFVKAAVLLATGVNGDGHHEVLGMQVATSETKASWNTVFAGLVACCLGGVRLVTSDAHAGLSEAIPANLSGAVRQRCRTQYAANLMAVRPESMWPAVKAMLHSLYDQPTATAVHAQFDRLLEYSDGRLPAVEYLEAWRPPDIASGSQQYCRSGPVTASVGATNDFDCWEAALLPIRRAAPVTITQRRRVLPERVVAIRPQGRGGALGGVPAVPRIARDPGPVQLSTQLVHVRWFARWCTPAWKLLEEHLCSSPSTAVASAAASTAARRWQHLPSKAVGADGSQARHYWPPSAIIALPAPGSRRQYLWTPVRRIFMKYGKSLRR